MDLVPKLFLTKGLVPNFFWYKLDLLFRWTKFGHNLCNEISYLTLHLNVTQWFLAIFMEHRHNTQHSVAQFIVLLVVLQECSSVTVQVHNVQIDQILASLYMVT